MKRIVLIMTLAFAWSCTANSQTKKASTRSSLTVSLDEADGAKKEEYVIDRNDSTIFFKMENSQLMFLKIKIFLVLFDCSKIAKLNYWKLLMTIKFGKLTLEIYENNCIHLCRDHGTWAR